MESHELISYAVSMSPNGNDIWLSGGISATKVMTSLTTFNHYFTFSVERAINVIRGASYTFHDGPDLPIPLAGHCQIHTSDGHMLIYGGITAINMSFNANFERYQFSNVAYLWSNKSWSEAPNENPCSNNGQDLAFQQPCAVRDSNVTEAIIVTFTERKACSSILNLDTLNWSIVEGGVKIPIGGHLVTSLDKQRVFYLGGIYYVPQEIQSMDVFELDFNGWHLIKAKLPIGISSNETKSYPSLHNVTLT